MSVPVHATNYFKAARERMTQATLLRRSRHYALAMYVAGVAAECMLRAYHRAGSGSFGSLSPSERQDRIWDFLDRELNEYERTRISFIVTDTPEEHRILTAP